jgi:hypothetical protein
VASAAQSIATSELQWTVPAVLSVTALFLLVLLHVSLEVACYWSAAVYRLVRLSAPLSSPEAGAEVACVFPIAHAGRAAVCPLVHEVNNDLS